MRKFMSFFAPAALLAAAVAPASASASQPVTLSGDTPPFVANAQNLGPADPTQVIDFTVWLKLQNENKLDKQVQDIYTPGNANYHKFLNNSQFQAAYSPTRGNVNAVTNYLTHNGFTILDTAENNFYIKAEGTVGQVEQAFHVSINNYSYHGKSYRANSADPSVDSTMNGVISDITGLDNTSDFRPDIQRPVAPDEGSSPTNAVKWQVLCGGFNTSKTLNVVGSTGATFTQTYTGFVPCGYGATQLEKAYGVDKVLAQGINGSGQTVAITDAYGSPTILQDANAYAKAYGLPPLVEGQNFVEVSPPGIVNKPESRAQDPIGWQAEVTLDVEMVHAMAPGARIVLVASPNNYADLDEAINYVVVHHLANIVTNSWGLSADLAAPGRASRDERIFEQAAAEGIGLSFSSGDSGDEYVNDGYRSVDFPASSPWVTAVGGTSLFLNGDNSYNFETGWGTNLSRIYSCASYTVDSTTGLRSCTAYQSNPHSYGFDGGAGGGLSYNFTAQPWQASISGDTAAGFGVVGTHRAVPDVSLLADPYTGANVYITDESAGDTSPEIEPYGGTSVASPLFAGIMALVDQARAQHGLAPAGLAAQYLYNLPTGAVRDVTNPPTGVGNAIAGSSSAFSLYYGSRYSGTFFRPTFNQDSSLAAGTGWDDVTGVGTPNAPNFVAALAGAQ